MRLFVESGKQWKFLINSEIERANLKRPFKLKKKIYLPLFCGFDIETTKSGELSFMYIWQMSIKRADSEPLIIRGRTWAAFENVVEFINKTIERQRKNIIVFIANIGYEFQFMRKHFEISNFFAIKSRKPAMFNIGRIEFRDALLISGRSLAHLAKNYTKTQKLTGDLDYTILRNSQTPLTEQELAYCDNDVIILSEYAEYLYNEYILKQGYLPLTKTGILRNEVKGGISKMWKQKIINDFLPDKDTYNYFFRYLFRGGFVHANIKYVGNVVENVGGADFTSSYPFVMLSENFPMSKPVKCSPENVLSNIKRGRHCCFIVKFDNIHQTTNHSVESESKAINVIAPIFDNGRLMCAKSLTVFLTEVDYKIYQMFYTWDNMEILKAWVFDSAPLPDYLIEPLKFYYQQKQELKRAGKQNTVEYAIAKEMVNSAYGMTVTRLNFTEYGYNNDEWTEDENAKSYQQMRNEQFLNCMWGIYVTAYARYNLLKCVHKIADKVIYCDTDSIYYVKSPECFKMVKEYNNSVDRIFPTEKGGYLDGIGKFDDLGEIAKFKTLGAKRYIKTMKNGEFEQTIAGLPKGILKKYCDSKHIDVYEYFNNYMYVPELFNFADNTIFNKLRSKYIDDETSAEIIDNFGNTEIMHELSSVTLLNTDFTLTLSQYYLLMLNSIKDYEEGKQREIH